MFNQQMLTSTLDQNDMPYVHGLINTNPMPMNPSPISSLPPLYPSMMTPQLNPQAPFSNANLVQARYAAGGSVGDYGLTDMAEMLREQGDEDDMILAHINPEEAAQLGNIYGYDINPMTGLPQFGRGRRFLKKLARKVLPIAGAAIGNMIAPGVGAIIGGAATKAAVAKAQHKDPIKAAVRGAGIGAGFGYGLPLAGKALSGLGATNIGAGLQHIGAGKYGSALSALGSAFTGGAASPYATTGLGGIPAAKAAATGLGLKGLAQQSALTSFLGGAQPQQAAATSLYPNMAPEFSAEQTGGSLYPMMQNMIPGYKKEEGFSLGALSKDLGNMLLPAGIIGTLLRKERVKQPKEPSYEEMVSHMRTPWRPEQMARPIIPYQRNVTEPTQEEIEALQDINQPMMYPNFFSNYARGGYVDGHTGGQEDEIPAYLSDGEYVLSADVVSGLGDGNNSAGARKLDELQANVRKHQGRGPGLPPKSRSLSSYMNNRSKY